MSKTPPSPSSIRDYIINHFNLDELHSLCFDLSVDCEDLRGITKAAKAQDLVAHCQRRNRIDALLVRIAELRSDTPWPNPALPSEVAVNERPTSLSNIFTNIWYTPRRYAFWEIRNPDIGTLEVQGSSAFYRGERQNIVLTYIHNVAHARQGGSINNNWVAVTYGNSETPLFAFFAQARTLGMGELLGGSEELYYILRSCIHT